MESNYWKPALTSKHIHKDLDTGRATYTYNMFDGELRWTAPTLIRLVPPSEKKEMQIMKLLCPVNSKGGVIREPLVCIWTTHRDTLFRLGGDYSKYPQLHNTLWSWPHRVEAWCQWNHRGMTDEESTTPSQCQRGICSIYVFVWHLTSLPSHSCFVWEDFCSPGLHVAVSPPPIQDARDSMQ